MLPPRRSHSKTVKKSKHKEAHGSSSRFGMGDNYGTGIKAKVGKMRGDSVGINPVSKKQLGKPPKSLA